MTSKTMAACALALFATAVSADMKEELGKKFLPAASDMLTVYNAMKTELNRITNNGATAGVPSYTSWGLDYLKTQLDRLVTAIGKLDKSDANYQKYYDAIVCESISIRYIYESKRGKTYSTSVWGSFSSEAQRLGFIMKSEQDEL
jgi:hypothetical protein